MAATVLAALKQTKSKNKKVKVAVPSPRSGSKDSDTYTPCTLLSPKL